MLVIVSFLAHNAFVRTNRRTVAIVFVRLSETGIHCFHTVHLARS